MIGKFWSKILRPFRKVPKPTPRFVVIMTDQCRDQLVGQLHFNIHEGHEGVIYFLGLTTGATSLALSAVCPKSTTTPGSFDVAAVEIGKVIELATALELQVVGQLHTHPGPGPTLHSEGDLRGMKIRHPGYFSIVVPEYGARLPSLKGSHTLIWASEGFREVSRPIKILEGQEL